MKKLTFIAFASFLVLLVNISSVMAKQVVFVVDVSKQMGVICGEGIDTPLDIAKKRIIFLYKNNNIITSADKAALIAFSEKAQIIHGVNEESRDFIAHLLRLKTTEVSLGSLVNGIRLAQDHIKQNSTPRGSKIFLFTTGGEDSAKELLDQISEYSNEGIELQINLFTEKEIIPNILVGNRQEELLGIERIACSSKDFVEIAQNRQNVIHSGEVKETVNKGNSKELLEIVAEQIGSHPDRISLEMDLIKDLGFDRIAAYEFLVKICNQFQVPVPLDGEMTSLDEISNYIDSTPLVGNIQSFTATRSADENKMKLRSVISPMATTKKKNEQVFVQEVFYGTNRRETGNKDPNDYYNGERSPRGKISYGKCEVTIPSSHRKGALESAFLGLRFLENPEQHIVLKSINPLSKEVFFESLKEKIAQADETSLWEKDAVVFIHGYNVEFAEAAKRTAQIAYDFGFTGLPLMFSWPSDGKLYAYVSDREDSNWSVAHVEQFLSDVLEKVGPKRVHLVAHSMGNQSLIGALNRMALKRDGIKTPLFENVILAAPDFDAQLFKEQIAETVAPLAKGWTIYTSDKDAALNFSTKINSAYRLGLPVTPLPGIDVIDATGVEVTPWSVPEFHSYYATKKIVVEDIVNAIKGIAPSLRKLSPLTADKLQYWRLQTGL